MVLTGEEIAIIPEKRAFTLKTKSIFSNALIHVASLGACLHFGLKCWEFGYIISLDVAPFSRSHIISGYYHIFTLWFPEHKVVARIYMFHHAGYTLQYLFIILCLYILFFTENLKTKQVVWSRIDWKTCKKNPPQNTGNSRLFIICLLIWMPLLSL